MAKVRESTDKTWATIPEDQRNDHFHASVVSGYYEVALHAIELYGKKLTEQMMQSITKE